MTVRALQLIVLCLVGYADAALPNFARELDGVELKEVPTDVAEPFQYSLTYIGDLLGNAKGGLNTNDAVEYRGLAAFSGEFELTQIGFAPGGRLTVVAENGHGNGLSLRHVGDFQILSNIDADDYVQLSEYFWERELDRYRVKVGQQDANAEFAYLTSSLSFMHSSFGLPPTVPLPTFPDPGLGLTIVRSLTDRWSTSVGLFEGSPNGGRLRLSHLMEGGVFVIQQTDYRRDDLFRGHAGFWYHSPDVEFVQTGRTHSGNHGAYLGAEILLWSCSDHALDREIWLFGQLSWAPSDRNLVSNYYGCGIACRGISTSRCEDECGVGLAIARFSKHIGDLSAEQSIECFYRFQFNSHTTIQPDLQYVAAPSGRQRDSLAVGVRMILTY